MPILDLKKAVNACLKNFRSKDGKKIGIHSTHWTKNSTSCYRNNGTKYNDAANKWLREVCGVTSLDQRPLAEQRVADDALGQPF